MDSRLAASLVFALGVIVQVLILNFRVFLLQRFLKILLVFLGAFALSVIGLVDGTPLYILVFIFSTLVSAVSCYFFCNEFSQKIDEWGLVFLNTFAGFAIGFFGFRYLGFNVFLLLVLFLIFGIQGWLIFQKSLSIFKKAFIYTWYIILVLVFTIVQMDRSVVEFVFGDMGMTFEYWEVFLSGIIYVNFWLSLNLLIPLLPVKIQNKSHEEKLGEVRRYAGEFSAKFILRSQNVFLKLGASGILILVFWVVLSFFQVDFKYLLSIILLLVGFFSFESRSRRNF